MKVLLIILLLANLFILLSLIISKNKIKHKIEDKCIKELDNKKTPNKLIISSNNEHFKLRRRKEKFDYRPKSANNR